MVLSAVFAAVIAAASLIAIPIAASPVPVTLQVFAVLLVSSVLRPRAASSSVLIYLALGALGLPVFSGGIGGLAVMIGPRGGYLVGFLAASIVVSHMVSRPNPSLARMGVAMCLGLVVIYALGVMQLAAVARLTLGQAVIVGVVPFIPLDLVKALAAGIVGYRVKRLVRAYTREVKK
jgi:biotin transport system substrate-specific component